MFDGRAERRRGPIPLIRAVVDVPCIGFIFQQEFKRYGGIFLTEHIPESSPEPLRFQRLRFPGAGCRERDPANILEVRFQRDLKVMRLLLPAHGGAIHHGASDAPLVGTIGSRRRIWLMAREAGRHLGWRSTRLAKANASTRAIAPDQRPILDQTLVGLTGTPFSEGWEALVLGGPGFLGFRVSLLLLR